MTESVPFSRAGEKSWRADVLLLLPILIVAIALRTYMLGARSFWIDEGVSVGIARLPWHAFETVVTWREGNMALYYLLLRAWLRLGSSEAWIRGLSVISAVGTVAGVYFLGRRMFGRNVAGVAAGILVLNAYHIQYSQEARSYALLGFAATATTILLLCCVERPSRRNWTLFAIASGFAAYLHFFAIFVTAAQVMSVLLWRRRALKPGPLAPAAAAYAVLLVPVFEFVWNNLHRNQLDWVPPVSATYLYEFGLLFTGRGGAALMILTLALAVAALTSSGREWFRAEPSEETFSLGVILLWLFFPIAITIAISVWKHLFVPRYMVMCLPALALAVSRGITPPRAKWQAFALIVLGAFLLHGDRTYYKSVIATSEDWRGAAQFIGQHAQPGDAVIFNNGIANPVFGYYLRRANAEAKVRVILPLHNDAMPFLEFEGIPNSLMFPRITEGVPRLWAVDWTPGTSIGPLIEKYFERIQTNEFLRVRVSLYIPRNSVAPAGH